VQEPLLQQQDPAFRPICNNAYRLAAECAEKIEFVWLQSRLAVLDWIDNHTEEEN
jgi:hypothetical protein